MKKFVLVSLVLFLASGCASVAIGPMARATISPISGSTVSGTVDLSQMGDGSVEVAVRLTGVPPGVHGFHIHENGNCGDNGNAAGGHYNPTGAPHGAPSADPHHAGDFGNITADANGNVEARFTTRSITVAEGPISAIGRAIIVHANPDDLATQPTGNAGGRIGCGVVQMR